MFNEFHYSGTGNIYSNKPRSENTHGNILSVSIVDVDVIRKIPKYVLLTGSASLFMYSGHTHRSVNPSILSRG